MFLNDLAEFNRKVKVRKYTPDIYESNVRLGTGLNPNAASTGAYSYTNKAGVNNGRLKTNNGGISEIGTSHSGGSIATGNLSTKGNNARKSTRNPNTKPVRKAKGTTSSAMVHVPKTNVKAGRKLLNKYTLGAGALAGAGATLYGVNKFLNRKKDKNK